MMAALIVALLENAEHAAGVTDCLTAAGYAVCVVDSFAKAMVLLESQSVDLIISDVHLSNGGSVFDFLRWVKHHPLLRTTPFILFCLQPSRLAKYLSDGVRVAAYHLGAAKYISMDTFDPAVLSAQVAELLSADASVEKSAAG